MKKRYHFYIAMGLLLIGLIVASFLDRQLSEAIFDRYNGFGLTLSSFGMIPGYGFLSFLGGALLAVGVLDKKHPIWLRIIFGAFCVALYGLSTYYLGRDVFGFNGFYNEKLYWLGFVIMGVLMVGMFVFGYFMGKKNENPKMWIIILVLAGAMFMALVPGTSLLKAIMHRPRFRIAIFEGYADYKNWWQPTSNYKDIIASHPGLLTKEEFKSFPSGHSTAAMVGVILLSSLPLFDKKLLKYQVLFFYIGFAWALVVMFARILVGAHYLSDTCFGALLTIIFYFITNEFVVRLLLPKEEKPLEVEEEQ